MRVLVITQYFWPENFRINDLVIGLKERGHEVIVLTGKPNYPKGAFFEGYGFFIKSQEFWEGVKIYRSKLLPRRKGRGVSLVLNYLSFAFFAFFKVLFIKEKPDCILVYEPSPITVGIPAILAKKRFKVPVFFWVQDLWPHSISSAGNVNSKTVMKSIDRLTRWIYKYCDKILIQSEAFRNIVLNQNIPDEKIIYFPNWTEEFYIPLVKQDKYKPYFTGEFNLVFAGNIGESQDFNTLIQTAAIVNKVNPNVHWIIIGDGRMKEESSKKVNSLNLQHCFKFIGAFPPEDMPKFFSHATALVVSLKKDPIFSITIPSKIQSYLACGKPVLTSLDGEGSRIIDEAKAGASCNAASPNEFADSIIKFLALPEDLREKMGNQARLYYEKVFDRNMLIDHLVTIMDS